MTRHLPSRPRFSGVRRRLGSLPHGLPTALTFTGAISVALLAPLMIVGVAAEQIRDRPDLSTTDHRGIASLVDPPAASIPPFAMAAAWARVADAGSAAPTPDARSSSDGGAADRSGTAGHRDSSRATTTPDAGADPTSRPRTGAGSRDAQARRRHRSCDGGGSTEDGGSCPSGTSGSPDREHDHADPTPSPGDGAPTPGDGAPTPSPEDDD